MTTPDLDRAKAEEFAERMVGVLNEGAIALMTSIGHRTGLFDAMAGLPPSTSDQIADAAGLNERYVREWLGAMVVGKIIEHDPQEGTYQLPQEHAAFLTRAASPDNIAAFASTYHSWDPSRTGSSKASSAVAGCPTRPSPVSTRSWPRTAARRSCRPSKTTSCR
jgi:hypothetical protein